MAFKYLLNKKKLFVEGLCLWVTDKDIDKIGIFIRTMYLTITYNKKRVYTILVSKQMKKTLLDSFGIKGKGLTKSQFKVVIGLTQWHDLHNNLISYLVSISTKEEHTNLEHESTTAKKLTYEEARKPFTVQEAKQTKSVSLASACAKKLFQPVFGGTNSSRYYVVAYNNDVGVAARIKYFGSALKLSIRVEGNLSSIQKAKLGIYFDFSETDKRISTHIDLSKGESKLDARVLIMTFLVLLEVNFTSSVPQLKLLESIGFS